MRKTPFAFKQGLVGFAVEISFHGIASFMKSAEGFYIFFSIILEGKMPRMLCEAGLGRSEEFNRIMFDE